MRKKKTLLDEYQFSGFYPQSKVEGIFGDHKARIVFLKRRQKKLFVEVVGFFTGVFTIRKYDKFGIFRVGKRASIWSLKSDEYLAGAVAR